MVSISWLYKKGRHGQRDMSRVKVSRGFREAVERTDHSGSGNMCVDWMGVQGCRLEEKDGRLFNIPLTCTCSCLCHIA